MKAGNPTTTSSPSPSSHYHSPAARQILLTRTSAGKSRFNRDGSGSRQISLTRTLAGETRPTTMDCEPWIVLSRDPCYDVEGDCNCEVVGVGLGRPRGGVGFRPDLSLSLSRRTGWSSPVGVQPEMVKGEVVGVWVGSPTLLALYLFIE